MPIVTLTLAGLTMSVFGIFVLAMGYYQFGIALILSALFGRILIEIGANKSEH